MKKLFIMCMLVAFAGIPAFAYASVIGKPANNLGLVGYWSFNDGVGTKAGDSSGFGNTGILATDGSALPVWTNGKLGRALEFDGIQAAGSYVDIASSTSVSHLSGAMTVCAWIKKDSFNTWDTTIISNGIAAGGFNVSMQYDLEINNDTQRVDFGWSNGADVFETRSSANFLVQAGIWYYICGERDAGATGFVFLNGVDVSANPTDDPASVIPAAWGGDAQIGRWAVNGNQMFNGAIDEVRLYNRALSTSSIMALYLRAC